MSSTNKPTEPTGAAGVEIVLDGETMEFPAGACVSDLVERVVGELPDHGIAVALDGSVVPRSQWESTQLTDGARADLLTAVQGG